MAREVLSVSASSSRAITEGFVPTRGQGLLRETGGGARLVDHPGKLGLQGLFGSHLAHVSVIADPLIEDFECVFRPRHTAAPLHSYVSPDPA